MIKLISRFHNKAHFPRFLSSYRHIYKRPTAESWLEIYQMRQKSLELWFKDICDDSAREAYGIALQLADQAIQALSSQKLSDYLDWSYGKGTLIHGDLHGNNVIFSAENDFMLDMDCTQFGHQAMDLHKLIPLLYRWNRKTNIQSVFQRYFHYYQKPKRFYKIYLAVAMFPHCFYRLARRNRNDTALFEMAQMERKRFDLLTKMQSPQRINHCRALLLLAYRNCIIQGQSYICGPTWVRILEGSYS